MADIYDDIIDRSFTPENLQLKGTLYTSLDSNPDEEAGLHKLSQKTGMPVEALRKDRGAEARRRAALIDTEQLPAEAPKTAEFVTLPENAALAHDDLSNLSALEKLVTAFRSGREQQEQGRLSHARMTGEISLEQADRFQNLERNVRSSQRMIEGASDYGLLDAAQIAGQMWESAAKAVPLALGAGMSAGGTAAVLGQVGPQVALPEEIITVPAAFATAFGTALTYGFLEDTRKVEAGHAYQELTQIAGENGESIDENTAAIAAQTVGVVNATIEGLGLKIITAPYRKALKRAITAKAAEGVTQLTASRAAGRFAVAYGTQVAAETGQEIAQETVNVLAEEMAKLASEGEFETTSPEEVASRLWEIASKTASGMAWLGLPGAGVSLNNDLQAARAAQKNQQFMQALGETAKGSKLRERLPEKFRELVARIKEGGPVENVYVPAEQWKTFWQEKGIDPAEMAQGLNYAEALATGADVVIPLEDYATRFAASEYHGELMRDVRLREDQMTAREAEEFQQTAAERFGSLVEEAEGDDSSHQVYEDVFGELIGIGRERSTAEREALLWQARYRARAERLGMDAFELYQQAPLKITRPLPEVLQRGTIDTSIDPYLDALRAGELPFADHGPSLLEFMRERGIADDRGDMASMEVDKGRKPFTRKLLREDGMSIDKAREAAVEAGYLSEDADINALIQAVDTELRGTPVYAQGRMDEEGMARRQEMEQLQEYLQSMGVDLAQMDNETVRKTLDQGQTLYQNTETLRADVDRLKERLAHLREKYGETPTEQQQEEIDQAERELFQTLESEKRGSITFSPGLREISFFEKADLSTFLHESGHAWLEELRQDAFRENAPEQVKEDWQSIAAWLEIDPDQEIPVAAHETFARGIEAYILEGNAPSAELAPVFQRFKAWLLRIYKSLQGLNVTLNKDVRAVMDRLLATDEQIMQAEQMQGYAPLFATAAEAGMTETEFAAYRKIAEAAHEEAARDLQQKLMAELSREQKAWWKEEREKVRAEVEAEAKKNPVYQAFQLLTKGEDFDGKAVEGFKLAKSALVKRYGEAFVKRLPRAFQRVYTKKGGMHPDEAAEVFGFSSGDEMVQAMVNTPPMKQAIEAETDVRMREIYGDLMLDGSIADEAMNSVHSDQRGKVLQAELRALRKKQREVSPFVKAAQKEQRDAEREGRQQLEAIPPLQAFRLFAAQLIGGKAVKDIRPDLYLKAEQKAGRLAFEAAAKKDYLQAAEEKRKQLLNHFLFMEARKARVEAETIYDYARKLEKPATQSRIGKAGADYLEQINAILEQYEFKQVTGPALAKRQSLLEWARQQEELGLEAAIPQEVLDEIGRRNYKTLSIDALRAVRDALKNIEHLSREANRIRIEGEEIELAEAVRELSASATEHFDVKRLPIDKETRSWLEKKRETLSRLDASLIKAEQLFEWLDGGAVNGPWNRMIFEPLAKAQAREFDLTKEYTQKIAELFQAYGKEKGNLLVEKVYIPALGESLTRQAILSVALNTGNASNYAKLLEGYQWTPEALEQILSHLDGADWAFVQSVWDTIETLWPEIAAMEKRLTGLEPPKVQAREFTNRHGTFRGGYYPVVYDPLHSQAGEKQTDARGEKLFDSTYVRATTEKGHTKARIEQAAYPILLSLEIIPQHLAQVIHDITHREAVVNANRLLAKTKDTLNATAGPAYHRMLKQWLASVANDRNIDQTGNQFWTQFFTTLRINATIVGMGLRVTTMFTQIAGLSQSLDIVKGRYLAQGLKTFARSPFAARAWVNEKSGEMRHRSNALDRDVRDGVRKLMGKKGGRAWIQAKSFAGIALFDALVSTPTWIGGYEQAKAEGLSEKDAIASGDRSVRLSQGAGGAKDLAAVQRSNDLMKLFTMFYSYFSVLYNRLRNMGRLKGIGEIGFMDVAFKSFVMVMFPAVVSELLANRGPDDDEEPAEWALRKIAFYPFMTIPVVRDVANALESDYGYTMTPLSRALETASKLPGQIDKTLEGEKDVDDLIFQAWDLPGYLYGLPTGQAKKTTKYIWDVWNGDIQPEDGGDIAKGLLFGERRK